MKSTAEILNEVDNIGHVIIDGRDWTAIEKAMDIYAEQFKLKWNSTHMQLPPDNTPVLVFANDWDYEEVNFMQVAKYYIEMYLNGGE